MDKKMADWSDSTHFNPSETQGDSTGFGYSNNNDFELDDISFGQSNDFEYEDFLKEFEVNSDNNDAIVFDNNGHGGHGNLSFGNQPLNGHNRPQSFPATAGLNAHQFFDAATGLDGSFYRNSNHAESSFTTPADGSVEQTTQSMENGKALKGPQRRKKAASRPLKDEKQDSDDEYDSNAENEEDEEVDGKTRRKPYSETRILTRWNTGQDQLLLLALQYECDLRGIKLPWGAAMLHVNADAKADSIKQHLTKVRKARIYYGMAVPPRSGKEKDKLEGPPIQYSDKDIGNFATITYTKPGTDEAANGTPGTLTPIYTPRPIEVKPQLPYYGKPGWPLSMEKADEAMADLALRGSRWSTTTPFKIELQDDTQSTGKKGKSAKAIKVEQREEDDDEYTLRSTRKVQSTPTASQNKKMQTSTPKSVSKGSPIKPKGVEKSKKASTPLRKTKTKAVVDGTPLSALTKELASIRVKSSPAKTPSRKAATATPKKSSGTKKKGRVAKTTPPMPSSEEETPANHTELPVGKYGRREEDIRIELSETLGDSMDALPAGFDLVRNLGSQSLDSQAIPFDTVEQSKHHQGSQSSNSHSAMLNVPDQSMQHQSNFANNMSQLAIPDVPDQSIQHQDRQIFGAQPTMTNGSDASMQNQGSYGYNGYGQQMPSVPMHHHGQHMSMPQNLEQPWQTQDGQNPMMNNNNNNNNNTSQMMPQLNPMQQSSMMQMLQAFIQQPAVMAQLTSGQGFSGFGIDAGPMVREHLPGFDTEMTSYMASSGPLTTQSPSQSFDNNTHASSVGTDNVDSKPQTLEGGPDNALEFVNTQLNDVGLEPARPNNHHY